MGHARCKAVHPSTSGTAGRRSRARRSGEFEQKSEEGDGEPNSNHHIVWSAIHSGERQRPFAAGELLRSRDARDPAPRARRARRAPGSPPPRRLLPRSAPSDASSVPAGAPLGSRGAPVLLRRVALEAPLRTRTRLVARGRSGLRVLQFRLRAVYRAALRRLRPRGLPRVRDRRPRAGRDPLPRVFPRRRGGMTEWCARSGRRTSSSGPSACP